MRRTLTIIALTIALSCGKKETAAPQSATAAAPPTVTTAETATTATTSTTPASEEPSLVSFAAGALLVNTPKEYGAGWPATAIIDEYSDHGWASPQNDISPTTFLIELPEQTVLDRLEFDTASADGDKRGAKDVSVEISDTSADAGFQKLADVSLADKQDRQSFPVAAQIPGRWIRLTVKNNQGSKEYVELMDFRGYGKQISKTPFGDASGTYQSDFGLFHLKQEGTSVTGCYEHDGGLLTGGIEGRVLKFTWQEDGGPDDNGPAFMVFTRDGKKMFGFWGSKGEKEMTNVWNGEKVSTDVGSCPNWSPKGGAEERMKKELSTAGRTRLYGINFDSDSDVIRDESKPTLDKVADLLKAEPSWKLDIEGHTDASGGDARNQELSQRRAESVRNYIVSKGIAADRLTAQGKGSSQPVADNETSSGRAQNRRVELVKQ